MSESQSVSAATLFVTCPKGVEALLAEEIAALGGEVGKTTVAGVYVHTSLAMAYRVCLWSRLANRVILSLVQEEGIETPEALHAATRKIDWAGHVVPGGSLAVDFQGKSARIRHTRFGAQTVKD
ncbi:23S rRNA (guanine(2445)-N(2))/(guanine(2069)-N(7))-methyltransferase, partial [Halomonas sp. BBD48]|nr:23S rRNA (guanine(2445)-N(2))/(guanine(2069)-N(7))-methyltransferase [Halomonas sp. BBD48]